MQPRGFMGICADSAELEETEAANVRRDVVSMACDEAFQW